MHCQSKKKWLALLDGGADARAPAQIIDWLPRSASALRQRPDLSRLLCALFVAGKRSSPPLHTDRPAHRAVNNRAPSPSARALPEIERDQGACFTANPRLADQRPQNPLLHCLDRGTYLCSIGRCIASWPHQGRLPSAVPQRRQIRLSETRICCEAPNQVWSLGLTQADGTR